MQNFTVRRLTAGPMRCSAPSCRSTRSPWSPVATGFARTCRSRAWTIPCRRVTRSSAVVCMGATGYSAGPLRAGQRSVRRSPSRRSRRKTDRRRRRCPSPPRLLSAGTNCHLRPARRRQRPIAALARVEVSQASRWPMASLYTRAYGQAGTPAAGVMAMPAWRQSSDRPGCPTMRCRPTWTTPLRARASILGATRHRPGLGRLFAGIGRFAVLADPTQLGWHSSAPPERRVVILPP